MSDSLQENSCFCETNKIATYFVAAATAVLVDYIIYHVPTHNSSSQYKMFKKKNKLRRASAPAMMMITRGKIKSIHGLAGIGESNKRAVVHWEREGYVMYISTLQRRQKHVMGCHVMSVQLHVYISILIWSVY